MLDIALILVCVGLLAKILGAMARDPRVHRPAMKNILAFAAIFVPGVVLLSVTAGYFLAVVTQNKTLVQTVLLAPVVVSILAIESFRWKVRFDGVSWRPGRLFRTFEVALPVLAVALVTWAVTDPVSGF